MSVRKEVNVPFVLALNSDPAQYGLADLQVRRYTMATTDTLSDPVDITSGVDIDEFMDSSVSDYTETPTTTQEALQGTDAVNVTGFPTTDTKGDIIALDGNPYEIKEAVVDGAGDGYVRLTTPLRATVASGVAITRVGNTGQYRITIQESQVGVYQYEIVSPSARPGIRVSSAIVEIVTEVFPGSSGDAPVVDNSKLLL